MDEIVCAILIDDLHMEYFVIARRFLMELDARDLARLAFSASIAIEEEAVQLCLIGPVELARNTVDFYAALLMLNAPVARSLGGARWVWASYYRRNQQKLVRSCGLVAKSALPLADDYYASVSHEDLFST